jgi:hypothetical protein
MNGKEPINPMEGIGLFWGWRAEEGWKLIPVSPPPWMEGRRVMEINSHLPTANGWRAEE